MYEAYNPEESYLRVTTACPEVSVADVQTNVANIKELYQQAANDGSALVVFPELSITGYTIGDLIQQNSLLRQARAGLVNLAEATKDSSVAMAVGLPLEINGSLYNCAAILGEGEIKGIVPKKNMPNQAELQEKRWFQAWSQDNAELEINGKLVPFGNDLLFDIGGVPVGAEICEDLWVNDNPSRELANNGALVVINPSASPELVGKASYRRDLVRIQSAKMLGAYVYASCDWTESTMDIVMSGHQMIAENGRIAAERKPFDDDVSVLTADIDIDHLRHDRIRDTNFISKLGMTLIRTTVEKPEFSPNPNVNPHPFLPGGESAEQRAERLQSVIDIQAHGLARRIMSKGLRKLHLGLSGGLDSTLAFLVGVRAAEILGEDPANIMRTYTMRGEASSDRTQDNAVKLAELYGIPNQLIPIGELSQDMLDTLDHEEQDVTYENVQARIRTSILLNKANQLGGIVLGTGDLTEIALGWCTFNADQVSQYHVNAGVPKTLVKHLVSHIADTTATPEVTEVLKDIVDTPISPELVKEDDSEISQKTEDQVGPMELHDFFIYHSIRWGDEPAKIKFLANQAFRDVYSPEEIDKWLGVYIIRFFRNQFKRSMMPDGAKVGSVSFSPRSDWRMPSDLYNAAVWED